MRYALLLLALASLAGCGGGGGGTAAPASRTALVTLSTSATPAGNIGGIDVTLNLPSGVTVRSVAKNGAPGLAPAADVITLRNTAANPASVTALDATYLPGPPAKVVFRLISNGGIPAGEDLATVACDIAAGSNPVPGDFSVTPNLGATGVIDLLAQDLPNSAGFRVVIN